MAGWLLWTLSMLVPAVQLDRSLALPSDLEPLPEAVEPIPLTLSDLEQRVMRTHPGIAQAQAKVDEARGLALQSGLYPNPFVAYEGRHIGADSTPGLQGGFFQQPIITGGKLRYNRALFSVDVEIHQWMLIEQSYLLINSLRAHYNEILSLQRRMELFREFIEFAEDVVAFVEANPRPDRGWEIDVLQARREVRELHRALANLDVRHLESWRELAALVGDPDLPPVPLEGTLESDEPPRRWEVVRDNLRAHSPELKVAELRVRREQFSVERERRERVPDLALRLGNSYDYRREQTVPFLRIYLELQLWDRNQGNILTAESNLINVRKDRERIWIRLQQRLARVFSRYERGLIDIVAYSEEAEEARRLFELSVERYREEEGATFSAVQSAMSAYITSVGRLEEALLEVRQAEVTLDGLLLTDEPIPLGDVLPPRGGLRRPLTPPGGNLPMRTIYP